MASPCIWRHCSWSRRLAHHRCLVFLLGFLTQMLVVTSDTDSQDAAALNALATLWKNTPSNWRSSDPCGDNWVGISCNDESRVTSISLSSLGLKGTLTGDIQYLTELQALDLSYNKGLTGGLPSSIGSLSKLVNLILVGCSFSGEIPPEIGSLSLLTFLSLNSNSFTGSIPSSIGNLSNLYWLDLADNKLSGTIPVSPGLDSLTQTKHFHFGMNQLSGTIPRNIFSSDMQLIHVLFDNNNLTGSIPPTLGLVETLEVLRLDKNSLTGPVPSNLNNLTKVAELHLANNQLTGPLPNLTGMSALSFVDMSNNSFDESDVPSWFSTLPSLTSLYLEYSRIGGQIPPAIFNYSPLQTVRLKGNRFNGSFDVSAIENSQLELIDLQDNNISSIVLGGGYSKKLILVGNPACDQHDDLSYCKIPQLSVPPYSTPQNCVPVVCASDQNLSPNCSCAYPYTGTLYFRSPSYSDLQNTTYYHILERELKASFLKEVPVDSVSLNNSFVNSFNNLEMNLQVFPSGKTRFSEVDVSNLGFMLSNQTFKPPSKIFGPFYFIGQAYPAAPEIATSKKSNHLPVIIGAAAGAAALALVFIGCVAFVITQRRKVKRTSQRRQASGSWDFTKGSSSSSIPQLKGARHFSFNDVKKYTNNFSEANEIGDGGYGKVYKGVLSNGQLVAVKRAQEGSTQGVLEFNTEVELLSRVHHKNLVSLAGFCFDQDEQILVYDYVPNGTLKESLSGKSGVRLDWKRRLRVALGAARGLAYLHELASPPIVHRDIKSSNILLDENLNAKVSDFGLSKPLGDEKKGHVSTQVKGTMGYLDPEYYMTQQLTEKSDVYSFGVLLLELVTAKKPIEHGRYVVREVRCTMDESKDLYGLHELIDPALGLGNRLGGFEKFVELAMKCVEESGIGRPTMGEVVKEIENIMKLAGMNPNADSASNSMSYAGAGRSSVRHPYSNEPFDYSGTAPSSRPEPK
ncbi:leucine-rich repeat receptor protein kinase HPCA1 [Musa acuminata AAA Group]|uniref:leucine-rich repeat receptor protein kinase HPCA1 n=1 Tax=Musa acuminata AAA Group TaxID=214697 RepID=UPI0031CF93BA